LAGCAGSDRNAAPEQAKQVSILFVHGGAWAGGSPAELEPLAVKYRGLGYNAISIEYRDGNNNILHQIDNVQAQVSKYRARGPVVLYGVSAGGTLAAALAAAGKVDGAVVVGAPTDLPTWSSNPYRGFFARKVLEALGMTPAEVRDACPPPAWPVGRLRNSCNTVTATVSCHCSRERLTLERRKNFSRISRSRP